MKESSIERALRLHAQRGGMSEKEAREHATRLAAELLKDLPFQMARLESTREPRRLDESDPINLVDEFIHHRWEEAAVEIERLKAKTEANPEYEQVVERGLAEDATPEEAERLWNWRPILSTEWNRLLESCYEMALLMDMVEMAEDLQRPQWIVRLPYDWAGAHLVYHQRAWFVHAFAMVERAVDVMRCTVQVYASGNNEALAIERRHERRVSAIKQQLELKRNEAAHGGRRPLEFRGHTEDGIWAVVVSRRQTPQMQLLRSGYPGRAKIVTDDIYAVAQQLLQSTLSQLGTILHDFEEELVDLVGRRPE